MIPQGIFRFLHSFVKIFFAYAAQRANPIFGELFEKSFWLNTVVGIADLGIVNIAADSALVFCHNKVLPVYFF